MKRDSVTGVELELGFGGNDNGILKLNNFTGGTDILLQGGGISYFPKSLKIGVPYTYPESNPATLTVGGDILTSGNTNTLGTISSGGTNLDQLFATVSSNTDTFVTGATLVGTTLNLKRNNGLSDVTVDLSPLSGTSVNNFVTGGTFSSGSGILSLFNNDGNTFNVSGFTSGGGSGGAFTVAGDNGTPFTIVSGDTLQFVGQSGLNIGVADPEVRIAMDYSGPDSFIMAAGDGTSITVDAANDKLVIYDDDATAVKYINVNQLPSGGGTFTGNTSATCINELWVSNISGCSPVTIGTEVEVKNNLNSSGVISSDTIGLSKSWLSSPPYIELFSHDPMTKSLYFNKNTILEKVFMGDPTNYDPDSLFTIYSDVAVKSGMTVTGDVEVGNDISAKTFTMKDGGVTSKALSVVPMNSQLNIGESPNFNKYFLGNETQPSSSVFATTFTVYADINATRELTVTSGITGNSLTLTNIPSYNDDSAAGTGGLVAGDVFQTTGGGASPLNVAGILMIKQ